MSVVEVGLAASTVQVRVWTKIVVKTEAAQTAATRAFKAIFDLGVLDFLISNLSLRRRVGFHRRGCA